MPTIKHALILMATMGTFVLTGNTVSAWGGNDVTITAENYDYAQYEREYNQDFPVETIPYKDSNGLQQSVLARVQRGKSVKLAYIFSLAQWAIAIGADTNYRYFEHTTYAGPTIISGTNTVVLPVRGLSMDGYHIAISNDITRDISPMYGQYGIVGYQPKLTSLRYWLQYQEPGGQPQKPYIHDQVYSKNKRFGVFWLNWQQFVRVDFKTGISTAFISRSGSWYDGVHASRASAITNDGRYVFMNDGESVVDIQEGCGYVINPLTYAGTIHYSTISCREQPIDPVPAAGYYGWHTRFRLAPDEKSANYWMNPFPYTGGTYEPKKVTITAGIQNGGRLTYLALGDSYSSGEGDTELNPSTGKKYYLDGTDKDGTDRSPREKCHISSRSYPFYLAGIMQARDDMESVACSGAVIDDLSGEGDYMGQEADDGTPRLEVAANSESLQLDAMNQYIPGRVRQIELVKQAKPQVITLTAGGNDAQFSTVLSACINVRITKDWTPTCYFADSESGRTSLRNLIADRYEPLKKLYTSLHAVSPESKIYVIGYPQFVNHTVDNQQCAANVRLNKAERVMVNEAVGYMNSVIERAATAAGVKYVDISDALQGHMLCDSKENPWQVYVTGIAMNGSSEVQESYHPNDGGHIMMTNAIKHALGGKSPLAYEYCDNGANICPDATATEPTAPTYFGALQKPSRKSITLPIVPARVQKDSEIIASIDPNTLRVSSAVSVTLLSQPRILEPITTLEDGGVLATIRIPDDIEPGYHTLIITGESVSGDPVEIIDFFEIIASEADKDGDGIPNEADDCQYVEPSGEDTDRDGVDDGCDVYISEPPKPQESSSDEEGASTSNLGIAVQDIASVSAQLAYAGEEYSLPFVDTTSSGEAPLAGLAPHDDGQIGARQDGEPNRAPLPLTELALVVATIVAVAGALAMTRLILARRV